MIVYGDQRRETTIAAQIARVRGAVATVAGAGLAWHGAVACLLIEAAGLLQGIADREMDAAGGVDAGSERQDQLMETLVVVATALDRSWRTSLAEQVLPDLPLPPATDEPISVRRPEGFAYYALFPELYGEAARSLPPGATVIGLRSIGTALASVASAAAGTCTALTVRPTGHPFTRTLAIGEELSKRIGGGAVALVDEGPGLSGSSLGGAVDWLEAHGTPLENIHILPGHGGAPGPQASPRHRAHWDGLTRHVADFESVIVAGRMPLAGWFEDIVGPATEPLEDLSGGAWRARSPTPDAPADPAREARKWRLVTDGGAYRIKFVGLDAGGVAALDRARLLGDAGFSPRPLALRYGMMLEPWLEAEAAGPPDAELLARYLRFRAENLPAERTGATLVEIAKMARFNLGQQIDQATADRLLDPWPDARLRAMQAAVRPVHVDARLHAWEWLRVGGTLLKTDAVDHSQAHDLIGAQDIAWDVAGAAVEFGLGAGAVERLARAVGASADLVAFLTLGYCGFQCGWWSMAAEARGRGRAAFYLAAAVAAR